MKLRRNQWILAILALCLVVCTVAGIAYAKYLAELKSDADIDVTAEGILTVNVTGPAGGAPGEPGEYTVTNDANSTVSAYVRVAVVVNWKNSENQLWAVPPTEGTDYTIDAGEAIQKLGGYYYYKGIRNPGDAFTITVTQQPGSHAPSDFSMHVQVLAEGIQCLPASAAGDAWGTVYQDEGWTDATP